ncbi:MAG TPA: adenylate/guanylate cyclase domain-containing protein [bacterium]|nr:adenylate/guanylate cyclase domain-containing protein [bacterium]
MPNPLAEATATVQKKIMNLLVPLVLWLGLSFGMAAVIAQFTQDDNLVHYVGFGTAILLLFWWFFLAWRLGNRWLLDLQELLIKNQMIPFNAPRIKTAMPWDVTSHREKLLTTTAIEYRKLVENAKVSNQTLEKYVGTSVSEKASKKALQSELGGELRKVYVLFSDVRGFTHMTEQIKPEETVEVLNKMFTAMEEVITQNGGDINKYIGDAIFAFFRRPYGNEGEAAKMVLRTAVRMQDRFDVINQSFKVAYSRPLDIGLGIGVTAGEAIMGNLGSSNRMEFTLIGDTVNMASRLCGVAKHGQVLVNEEMYQAAKDHFEMTPLPAMKIKGKEEMQTPYLVHGERLVRSN